MSNDIYEPPIRHMSVSTNISNKTGMKTEKIHPHKTKTFFNNAVFNFYTIIRSLILVIICKFDK